MYVTAQNPAEPRVVNLWLSHADINDRCGGWSSNASYLGHGYGLRVMVEGLDWQTLCRNHGLYGAIEKVVAEARRRYARTGYGVPIKKSA
jgi:SH3-like domain-containing protein